MTSLFFVMLVLFIICLIKVGGLYREVEDANTQLGHVVDSVNAENHQLEQILQLEEQFKVLSQSSSLDYDKEKRMFFAKDFVGREIFNSESDQIIDSFLVKVDKVGKDLENILAKLNTEKKFKYQLIIEGNAAIDWKDKKNNHYDPDNYKMYELSYKRALALYNRWRKDSIDLRKYNTEVIIAGSGFNGINRDTIIEDNNKRFIIQIIPKIIKPEK